MKNLVLLLSLLLLNETTLAKQSPPICSMKIQVAGVNASKKGKLCAFVFSEKQKDIFPRLIKKAAIIQCIDLSSSTVNNPSIAINFQTAGYYAYMVIHDEDSDQILKSNWIGIPKEGVATSNDARGRFGPPSFEKAKFEISSKNCPSPRQSLKYL